MTILWFIRTALFLISSIIPVLHPAVAVSCDSASAFLWFAVVPLEMAASYYLGPGRTGKLISTAAFIAPIAVSAVIFTRFDSYTWITAACGAGVYALTYIQFRYKAFILGFLEASFLAVRAYRLLLFSRASEDIASSSSLTAKLLFTAITGLFAVHLYIAYLISFRKQGSRDCLKEHLSFASAAALLIVLVGILLPPDFVEHSIVLNHLLKEPEPKPLDLGDQQDGRPGGNFRSENLRDRSSGNNSGNADGKEKNTLEGIPAGNWKGNSGDGDGDESPQYAVMVIASDTNPVYAAGAYSGTLDPERGFLYSDSEPLNELTYKRLLETWNDTNSLPDRERKECEVDIISTVAERYLAYKPRTVVPTVYDGTYYPFVYSYRESSLFSFAAPEALKTVSALSESERLDLGEYLELSLDQASMERLGALTESWTAGAEGYYAKIEALMQGFSTYKYQKGFDDSLDIEDIQKFLFETKMGDCSEFSNTLALLARFLGVPSRVVTGYLASKGLQTQEHIKGLEVLQKSIPELQNYDIDSLYLVTTAHRHSWTQLYFPLFGWIDFESTAEAIPPESEGNPNSARIIIPVIEAKNNPGRDQDFQWLVFFRIVLYLSALSLISLYAYKAFRRILLYVLSRGETDKALQRFFLLLLSRMADSGCRLKHPSETAREYAAHYPSVQEFAETYSHLRYTSSFAENEKAELWASLRASYSKALKPQGFGRRFREIFSLRSLYY